MKKTSTKIFENFVENRQSRGWTDLCLADTPEHWRLAGGWRTVDRSDWLADGWLVVGEVTDWMVDGWRLAGGWRTRWYNWLKRLTGHKKLKILKLLFVLFVSSVLPTKLLIFY